MAVGVPIRCRAVRGGQAHEDAEFAEDFVAEEELAVCAAAGRFGGGWMTAGFVGGVDGFHDENGSV